MSLSLLFCHGWGFDAAFWNPLAALLPEYAQARDDAGYFGQPEAVSPSGPFVAITHSFGTMRFLGAPASGLVGLVAIAGFDRFSEAEGFPGTPRRVVDRMVSAVAQEPETVLADFHHLFDSTVPDGTPDAERLHYGSRLAERTVVYTHRDTAKVMAPWADKRIHRSEDLRVYSFDPGFIDSAAPLIARRNTMTLTVTEQVLYLDLNGTTLTTAIHEHQLG